MGVSESRLNCIRSLLLTGVGDSGKAKPVMEFTFPVIYNCAVNFYFTLFFLPAFFQRALSYVRDLDNKAASGPTPCRCHCSDCWPLILIKLP